AVGGRPVHDQPGIHGGEDALGDGEAGEDAVLFDEEDRLGAAVGRDGGEGRYVARPHVFGEGAGEEGVERGGYVVGEGEHGRRNGERAEVRKPAGPSRTRGGRPRGRGRGGRARGLRSRGRRGPRPARRLRPPGARGS